MPAMKRIFPAAALLGLVLAAGGCEEVAPPGNAFEALEREFNEALKFEGNGSAALAEARYQAAAQQAEALLPSLAPGDELAEKTREIRRKSLLAMAAIRENRRRETAGGSAARGFTPRPEFASQVLPPPVLAYQPPQAARPPDEKPPGAGDAANPAAPPEPGKATAPEPGKTPEPPKPKKDVVIDSVTLKKGKILIVYWTFTNLTEKGQRFGAPIIGVLNKTGGQVTTMRATFEAAGFQLNEADPPASTGKHIAPESFGLAPGEGRTLVSVGELSESTARQLGGASVNMRMNDDRELTDECTRVDRE